MFTSQAKQIQYKKGENYIETNVYAKINKETNPDNYGYMNWTI